MEAQKYLKQVLFAEKKIKNKLAERQKWKDIALSITACMGGERVQTSGSKDKMANAVEECEDAESQVLESVKECRKIIDDVTHTIENLDSATEYDLLHMRYVQHMDLQEIADEYRKEYGWATTTHGRALKNVQALLDAK